MPPATPEQVRKLFVDVAQRANKLAKEPEYYNTLTNNCDEHRAAYQPSTLNTVPYGRESCCQAIPTDWPTTWD